MLQIMVNTSPIIAIMAVNVRLSNFYKSDRLRDRISNDLEPSNMLAWNFSKKK
jgi:hypothetical protein